MHIYVTLDDFAEFWLERVGEKRRIVRLRELLRGPGIALQTFDEKDAANWRDRPPCADQFCEVVLRPAAGETAGFEGDMLQQALLAVGALCTLRRATGAAVGFESEREQQALRAVGALVAGL